VSEIRRLLHAGHARPATVFVIAAHHFDVGALDGSSLPQRDVLLRRA
jgi:hypothetical protein